MKLGDFVIEQLSEGFFELFNDGSFVKMDPYRLDKPENDASLGKFTSALGIDPLLIQTREKNIIIDPGLGWGLDAKSSHKNTSNVVTNLDVFDLSPEDIDIVILSHLHYDHSAGCTYVSENFTTKPTFPNASYILHKDEWDYALTEIYRQHNGPGANYQLDELYRLVSDGRFQFIEEKFVRLESGLTIIKSGGHTPGHCVVKIKSSEQSAYYMGDLIPTEYHLNHYPMKQIDFNPVLAKKVKMNLLKDAYRDDATMFFYHSLYRKTGRLAKDSHKNYVLIDP